MRCTAVLLCFTPLVLGRPASADVSTWPFVLRGDYLLSDSTQIEIADGLTRLIPIDQTDEDGGATGFGGGIHSQTQWDGTNGWLELAVGAAAGQYTSRVIDAGAPTGWDSIAWIPRRPCLKELPSYKALESGYLEGNADMSQNVLLLHLNESPCADGASMADSSGEANNGVVYTGEGGADKSTAGILGAALGLDGVDDYVEVPYVPSLDMTGAATIEAWIDPSAGGAGGTTLSSPDSYEFDPVQGGDSDIIHVAGDVYAIAYGRDKDDSDGYLCTVRVLDDGTIAGGLIDSLEYDDRRGLNPDIVHVAGDVYAIAYTGPVSNGWLKTFRIGADGSIGDAPLDAFEFDGWRGDRPCVAHVADDVYAIAYSGRTEDGWLATVQIASDGRIGNRVLDSLEFDTARGAEPDMIHVAGDVYAIAYSGARGRGWVVTVDIAGDGRIGNSVIDNLEFDAGAASEPDMVRLGEGVYAIAYSGPGQDGWVVTVGIAAGGGIGPAVLDAVEFDTANAAAPCIFQLTGNVYGVAYGGLGLQGWLVTGHINGDGTIAGTFADRFQYDVNQGADPSVIRIGEDIFAIAYSGLDDDGYLATYEVLTDRGIIKAGAYEIDADSSYVYATVNDNTVFAPLLSGWNHIALVYEGGAGGQQLLYVNGALAATAPSSGAVGSDTSPVIVGNKFSGRMDEVAMFGRALSAEEVADHYYRAALSVKYQVRTGSSDPPSGPFVGPDGTEATFYSGLLNATTGLPSLELTNLPDGRYFQYRVQLETIDISTSPGLVSVSIGPPHYPLGNPTVQNAAGLDYFSLFSFGEILGAGNAGEVRYQISNDGSSWYYWNGSSWVAAADFSQSNTAAEINANCGTFDDYVGAGQFFFKAFLHAVSSYQGVELDQVDLGFIGMTVSVSVDNTTFSFGTRALNTWLLPDSTVIVNDGTVAEDFLGKISQFSEGANIWGISDISNGDDVIRVQWSIAGTTGPWNDVSAYDTEFAVETNVAVSDSVTLWFRIMTPTATSSYGQYSSTLTVTAQQF